MAPTGSALSTPAIQPPSIKKETATGIAVPAARAKCARQKAAPLLRMHVVFASSMVLMESASLMAAPPMQQIGWALYGSDNAYSLPSLAVPLSVEALIPGIPWLNPPPRARPPAAAGTSSASSRRRPWTRSAALRITAGPAVVSLLIRLLTATFVIDPVALSQCPRHVPRRAHLPSPLSGRTAALISPTYRERRS